MNNGSKAFREKNGLDLDGYCAIRMTSGWKLDLMAKMIFQTLWPDKKSTVQIKEYGEDNPRPHHTYDRAIQFTSKEAKAYLLLIAACVERYSGRTAWTTAPYPANCLAYEPEDSFPPFMTLHIGHDQANEYRRAIGRYVRKGQWTDLTVDVYL